MLRRAHILTLSALLLAAPVLAQSTREQIEQLQNQRRDKTVERDDLRAEAATAAREALTLLARLGELGRAQAGDEGRQTVEKARFETLNGQEQALALRMAANRAQFSRLLGALQLKRRDPAPAHHETPSS